MATGHLKIELDEETYHETKEKLIELQKIASSMRPMFEHDKRLYVNIKLLTVFYVGFLIGALCTYIVMFLI